MLLRRNVNQLSRTTALRNNETIVELEKSAWEAVVKKDGSKLEKLFADDYIEVTVDGKRFAKGEIVEKSPHVDEIDSFEISEARVLFLEQNVALLNYKLNLEGKLRNIPISPKSRWVVSLWKQTNSIWKCAYFQQTAYHAR